MDQKESQPQADASDRPGRRVVPANLIEQTPGAGGIAYWLLAAPLILFLGWLWLDLFVSLSPFGWLWLELPLGVALFVIVIILPLGYGAHRVVTALPGLFQNAGWDVEPLEPVAMAELPMIRYAYRNRYRATTTWSRAWVRAAQGWVYLEIAAIFVGAIAMIPLFFSAVEFGFGR